MSLCISPITSSFKFFSILQIYFKMVYCLLSSDHPLKLKWVQLQICCFALQSISPGHNCTTNWTAFNWKVLDVAIHHLSTIYSGNEWIRLTPRLLFNRGEKNTKNICTNNILMKIVLISLKTNYTKLFIKKKKV